MNIFVKVCSSEVCVVVRSTVRKVKENVSDEKNHQSWKENNI